MNGWIKWKDTPAGWRGEMPVFLHRDCVVEVKLMYGICRQTYSARYVWQSPSLLDSVDEYRVVKDHDGWLINNDNCRPKDVDHNALLEVTFSDGSTRFDRADTFIWTPFSADKAVATVTKYKIVDLDKLEWIYRTFSRGIPVPEDTYIQATLGDGRTLFGYAKYFFWPSPVNKFGCGVIKYKVISGTTSNKAKNPENINDCLCLDAVGLANKRSTIINSIERSLKSIDDDLKHLRRL